MNTKQKIASMLIDTVGHSIFDSGSYYGRAYSVERTQIRKWSHQFAKAGNSWSIDNLHITASQVWNDELSFNDLITWLSFVLKCDPLVKYFDAKPYSVFSTRWGFEYTQNTYHYLNERLDFAASWRDFYDLWHEEIDSSQYPAHWTQDFHEFFKWLDENNYADTEKTGVINTYNNESTLDRILQYEFWHVNFSVDSVLGFDVTTLEDQFYILQIHGGCDARSGYTEGEFFTDNGMFSTEGYLCVWDAQLYTASSQWFSDDAGYNFYNEDTNQKLSDFEESNNPLHKGDGEHIYVSPITHKAYCPISGLELKAS
jgi:hypothetical protein